MGFHQKIEQTERAADISALVMYQNIIQLVNLKIMYVCTTLDSYAFIWIVIPQASYEVG